MAEKNKKRSKQDNTIDWKEKLDKDAKEKLGYFGVSENVSAVEDAGMIEIEQIKSISEPAKAPYNFVPLNENVIKSEEKPGQNNCTFDKFHSGKNTGYIELTIKTKTPLYIRDTLNQEEMERSDEAEKSDSKFINPDFFSPAGEIRIPGSSLRGMVRNLVEIISYGKMKYIDHKKKYHFRSFADKSLDLRDDYTSDMMTGTPETGYHQQVKAGYLTKVGIAYKIKPAKSLSATTALQYARVEESKAKGNEVLTTLMSENGYRMGYKKVEFLYDEPKKHEKHKKPLYYAKVTDISPAGTFRIKNPEKGYLIHSGKMPGKPKGKHMHWVINEVDKSAALLEFDEGVIENYRNDNDRKVDEGAELLKLCKKGSYIPCFYIEKNNKVVSFGHTGLFRLAYKKSIKEFLPSAHDDLKEVDIAEAIFGNDKTFAGNEKTFAGRVFFEDAFLKDALQNDKQEFVPKILSTPKPTTFQHYLVQHKTITYLESPDEGYKGLQNYNDDTLLRGNKLYWHKTGHESKWEEEKLTFWKNDFNSILTDNSLTQDRFKDHDDIKKNKISIFLRNLPQNLKDVIVNAVGKYETQHTRIKPIEEKNTFFGRIRFENLSAIELGALLFALDLPKDCCHKIGMGKPLGLGSVEIKPKLYLSKRDERYKDLLSEWKTEIQESGNTNETIDDFKNEFQKYVLSKLGEDTITDLWEVNRMKELKRMLDFEKKPDDDKTEYMALNKFRERRVLPKPTEVK